ncbi:hypothetical protein T484DRAFT_1920747 [Baffinella frigidus]|nr:hypothetical protein T484DRAFT_1920747 [Cryptophyta sp. CCMP2293]
MLSLQRCRQILFLLAATIVAGLPDLGEHCSADGAPGGGRVCSPRPRGHTLVTGANSNHYRSLRQFLESVVNTVAGSGIDTVRVFDLGFSRGQALQLGPVCAAVEAALGEGGECTVEVFDISGLPPHVADLSTFAWKPLLIASVLLHSESVIWMDAGTYFHPEAAARTVAGVQTHGLLLFYANSKIGALTHAEMVRRLGGESVLDEWMACSGLLAIRRDSSMIEPVFRKWVECALVKDCIVPEGSDLKNHRQDQAALSILRSLQGWPAHHAVNFDIEPHQDVDFDIEVHEPLPGPRIWDFRKFPGSTFDVKVSLRCDEGAVKECCASGHILVWFNRVAVFEDAGLYCRDRKVATFKIELESLLLDILNPRDNTLQVCAVNKVGGEVCSPEIHFAGE